MQKSTAGIIIGLVLAGCGVEMAATTATVGALEAQSAQAAKASGDIAKNTTAKTMIQRAVNIYLAEKGAYPSALKDLVPDYLPTLPKRADGTPFGYNAATGKVLDAPAAP